MRIGGADMSNQDLIIPERDWRKLLAGSNGDSALLYLYLRAGGNELQAQSALRFSDQQMQLAVDFLKQAGLWQEAPRILRPAQPPVYNETDLIRAQESPQFPKLLGEVQRRLGKLLSTEECKILLSIYEYLGLSEEVVSILVSYCIQKSRSKGVGRNPSMHAIEREAYHWADLGIDTMEEAASYMQIQLERQSKAGKLRQVLQLGDRKPTAAEERFLLQWIDWGFGPKEVEKAYEKTCLNTGGLKWPYMNSILKSWHEQGLTTISAIDAGDKVPAAPEGTLSSHEIDAIKRIMENKEGS